MSNITELKTERREPSDRRAQKNDRREALLGELFGTGGVPIEVDGRMLRTAEVASLFQVSERAVTDWARRGRIPSVRTPGGHRRYPAHLVLALLNDCTDASRVG